MSIPADALDLSTVTFLHADIREWARTSHLTKVSFSDAKLCLEHSKKGQWPTHTEPDGDVLEGNPWVFARVGGKWFGATYEWLKVGQTCKGINAANIGPHIKRDPLAGWTPQPGELIGFCVSTFARDSKRSSNERTNVVLARWGQGMVQVEQPAQPPQPEPVPAPNPTPVQPPVADPAPSPPPSPPAAAQPAPVDLSGLQAALERLTAHLDEVEANQGRILLVVSQLAERLSTPVPGSADLGPLLQRIDQLQTALLDRLNGTLRVKL
jgi:hypothetical protein